MTDLSFAMFKLLKMAPDDWGKLPVGIYETNRTLCALENRGLVEVRFRPRLQWRKTTPETAND